MSCDFAAQVQQYHDGELSAADAARIESHLARCADCAAELKSLRAMSNLIGRNIPVVDLPDGLPDGLIGRLHAEVQTASDYSLLPLARNLIGVAAAVLIVASAGLWRFQPDEHASAPQAWEGAVLSVSNDSSSQSVSSMDPDLIVADLSRTSGH